jgi:thymidylate synthase (FAD)
MTQKAPEEFFYKESGKDLLVGRNLFRKLYGGEGHVILLDCFPRVVAADKNNADHSIAEMARISYGVMDKKSDEADANLVERLMEDHHTSPFEGVQFKFLIQCPIYVDRQVKRHRTAKVNEYSMRYSPAIDSFHYPELRVQDPINKQQSIPLPGPLETKDSKITESDDDIGKKYKEACEKSRSLLKEYKYLISKGVAREVARGILPVAEMTKSIWIMDAHNLFNFLRLRMDRDHAQKEIADLADAIYDLIKPVIPKTCAAFEKYILKSISLSSVEVDILRKFIADESNSDKLRAMINDSAGLRPNQKTKFMKKLGLIIPKTNS